MSLCDQYSGIVLNYDSVATASAWSGSETINFYLPVDYERGTIATEVRIPDMTGFQVLVNIAVGHSSDASFDWTLVDSSSTVSLSGTSTGAQTDGQVGWT